MLLSGYQKPVGNYRLDDGFVIPSCEIFVDCSINEVRKWLEANPDFVFVETYRNEHAVTNENSYKEYLKNKGEK